MSNFQTDEGWARVQAAKAGCPPRQFQAPGALLCPSAATGTHEELTHRAKGQDHRPADEAWSYSQGHTPGPKKERAGRPLTIGP